MAMDIIEKAKEEIRVFERTAKTTSEKLIAEVERLRKLHEVVAEYIDATGDVPGNNETWSSKFRDAYYAA